jgi:hypothetical protein
VAAVVVAGDSGLLPTVLPVPHSYTEAPAVPPLAVSVMAVAVPLHIVVLVDDKLTGAVGGVVAAMDSVTPPVTVALHAPAAAMAFRRTQ